MYDEYQSLEFVSIPKNILESFSKDTSPKVVNVLIKQVAFGAIPLDNEAHLDWVMQAINYAFTLRFGTFEEVETTDISIKVYTNWAQVVTSKQPSNIPEALILYGEKYFRKILDAFTNLFIPTPNLSDFQMTKLIEAQGQVLKSLQSIAIDTIERFQEHVWSNVLMFYLQCVNKICDIPSLMDDAKFKMINNILETLFDSWLYAAKQDFIPSLSYWKTVTELSRKCIHHVQLVETWGNKLMQLTSTLYKEKISSKANVGISIPLTQAQEDLNKNLMENWYRILNMLGAPSVIHDSAEYVANKHFYFLNNESVTAAELTFSKNQLSLSFFIASCTLSFVIDILYGKNLDPSKHVFPAPITDQDNTHKENEQMKHVTTGFEINNTINEMGLDNESTTDTSLSSFSRPLTSKSKHKSSAPPSLITKSITNSQSVITNNSNDTKNRQLSNLSYASISGSRSARYVYNILKKHQVPDVSPSKQSDNNNKCSSDESSLNKKGSRGPSLSTSNMLDTFMDSLLYFAVTPTDVNGGEKSNKGLLVESYLDVIENKTASDKYATDFDQKLANINNNKQPDLSYQDSNNQLHTSSAMSTTSMYEGANSNLSQRSYATRNPASRSASTTEMSSLNHQVNAQIAPRNSSSCVGSESGDYSQSDGYVDSIAAGKSLAISSICRIICSKNSCEVIGDEQLAKFYAALYDALVAKERIVLCTLLHTTTNLFSLGLPGVEILLPNYIMAIDLILTESMQLQLNPSIPQATMRHSCLKALGSVISWPTTFSAQPICTFDINPLGSEGKLLNIHNMVYLDIRVRILQILIHTLRNEIAPNNLCLVLSLCNIFYEECCAFDIQNQKERKNSSNSIKSKLQSQSSINEAYLADEDKLFCRSVVRGIVSAVCDNLCKSQWSSDRSICVSAIECLNAIPALHASIIFDNKDISTASLIVSSLCRFIDNQLMKPPMFHSKDLHSTVVSAYNSLNVWLCACPALTEIETCLKMVAKTIELGLTGGKNLEPENYNPASQRVRDAANCLLEHVFSSVSSSQLQGVVDERRLLLKYGPAIIDTTRFKHFLINNSTLLSIHEATQFSNVLSVFIVIRTPSKPAHANFIQLEGKSREEVKKNEVIESARYVPGSDTVPQCAIINQADLSSRSSSTSTSIHSLVNKLSIDEGGIDGAKNDQLTHDIKQFSFPTDFWQPLCKLDEVPCELTDTPTTEKILRELKQIKDCLDKGQSPIGRRSLENVWLNGGATNKNEVGNEGPASINSIPAFLYSMGLLSEECYQKELVQLDSGQCDRFYKDLHTMVDSSPVRIPQTVSLYYVKRGQRKVGEILANMENIMNLDSTFAYLLSDLGDGIQTKSHPFWTGSWNNSFSSDRKPKNYGNTCDNYSLDGTEYALYWSDNMMEFAFITPTVKSIEMAKNCKNPLLDKTTTSNQTIKKLQYNEIKILVIWVERFEDIELFPIGDLALDQFSNQPVEHIAFYLYSFEEDLIKVTVRETALKLGKPGPLIDEACVSKYSLASLIRTTVFNVSRRYIVEFDNYQSIQQRRKIAIQEFAKKYSMGKTYFEFLNNLLTDV